MNSSEKKYFTSMLTDKFLVPNFVYPLSKYNIDHINETMEESDKNALIASIVFDNHGVTIPFQYKLTDDQFKIYNDNKHDVIDTLVWYFFDYSNCKYLVETYGVFTIIKKVLDEYGAENTERIYKDKNSEELYCYYTYYILLEYFDNIVYLSNNNDNIATEEDIIELEKIMNEMTKIRVAEL
jgi:hypothetical protein